jgi:hypothetical protein
LKKEESKPPGGEDQRNRDTGEQQCRPNEKPEVIHHFLLGDAHKIIPSVPVCIVRLGGKYRIELKVCVMLWRPRSIPYET